MADQNIIHYQKTSPFPGWIRNRSHIDTTIIPDGSTMAERFDALKIKWPDSDVVVKPFGPLPDPEAVKYDVAIDAFVPLEPGDITPEAQIELDEAQRAQDIIDNLPSWASIESTFDSIRADGAAATTINQLKAALGRFLDLEEKHARITYWLAKDSRD